MATNSQIEALCDVLRGRLASGQAVEEDSTESRCMLALLAQWPHRRGEATEDVCV